MDLLWWLNGGGALFDGWSPANNLLQGHAYVLIVPRNPQEKPQRGLGLFQIIKNCVRNLKRGQVEVLAI
jgi:hypothetical protein